MDDIPEGRHVRPPQPGGADTPAPPRPSGLAIHRAGAVVVVDIRGELDAGTAVALDHILRDLICDQGNLHVAVDVGRVSDADTSGVAALVDACRLAREHHATLSVVNVPPAIEHALGRYVDDGAGRDGGVEACPPRSSRGARRPQGARHSAMPAAGPDDHVVEFYVREERLAESVRDFLLPALDRGQAALVVATEDHRRRFDVHLRAAGFDVDDGRRHGRYVSLDARQTLAAFMVADVPDGARFETSVGGLVRRLGGAWGGVRIFGEMVALLWADGNVGAAIALEDLWNSLRAKETFELLCAYPASLFDGGDATEPFRRVCDQHTRVVPTETTAVRGIRHRLP